MTGETDLARLIAALEPRLDDMQYAFEAAADPLLTGEVFAFIREAEAVTLVRPGRGWARITLGVQSSLVAVGLTARVASALAERGIAANVIAGLHHDHVFVPWDRRDEAMQALCGLSASQE
ncbi:MAG: ACT domain-containing protein [Allosphingosinicella sp.]